VAHPRRWVLRFFCEFRLRYMGMDGIGPDALSTKPPLPREHRLSLLQHQHKSGPLVAWGTDALRSEANNKPICFVGSARAVVPPSWRIGALEDEATAEAMERSCSSQVQGR